MRHLSNILLLIGGAALVWCAVVWTGSALFDWYEGRELARMPAPAAVASTAKPALPPPQRILHPHDVIGRLEIPRLHLSTVVLEGDDSTALRFGAGHVPWTPLPGQSGNVGIAAHRDTIFRGLRDVALRDDIRLTTPEGSYEYRVSSTEIVKPQDVAVLYSSAHPELTLVTCYPFSYLGSAPLRFIVHAQRVGSAGS